MSKLTIALDIMGGDFGPPVTLPAAVKAVYLHANLNLILFGDKPTIEAELLKLDANNHPQLTIVHCSQVVGMDEAPAHTLRHKTDSSMRKALDCLEHGNADACVSAGNTGALLTNAYYVLKTLPGVMRPALVSSLPTRNDKKVLLLDLGANVNCDSEILFQYAVMGAVMAEQVEGIERPRVALLNVGEEQIKGNDRVKHAAHLLQETEEINYIGYLEGSDIFSDRADVVVTDGFSGNVALKACEGLAALVFSEAKRVSSESLLTRLMAKMALPLLKKVYARVNPDQYNGASLLGLRGIVVKSHGNASIEAYLYAIEEAMQEVKRQVPIKIKDKLEKVLS